MTPTMSYAAIYIYFALASAMLSSNILEKKGWFGIEGVWFGILFGPLAVLWAIGMPMNPSKR